MKIKKRLTLVLFLILAGTTLNASAHDLNFKTLLATNGAEATDVWEVGCTNGGILGNSARLVAQIRDWSPNDSNLISLVLYKDGKAVTTTDLIGGDADYSPLVSVNAGNGVYTLLVNHSLEGNQVYFVTYHCENAEGDHTPTTVPSLPIQDQ